MDGSQRLSAVADQAGLSFEQMLGVLTGSNEILQNIEKTSSGAITVFTRLQGIQLPDEEDILPTAKLQESISSATNGMVNILDESNGQLRNAYDILDDINKIWDTLDKNTQEGIAVAAGGVRQKSVFLSMMQNWENVEKATQSAMNAEGSAFEENEKYLNSIQGKMAQFKSTFQELSAEVVSSGLIKSVVESGTIVLKIINEVTNAIGGLGAIGTGAGIFAFLKNFSKLNELGDLSSAFSEFSNIRNIVDLSKGSFNSLEKAFSGLTTAEITNKLATANLTQAQRQQVAQCFATDAATTSVAATEATATVATTSLGTAFKGLTLSLKGFVLAHPIITAIAGISAVVIGATKAYDKFNTSLEESKESFNKLKSSYDETLSDLDSTKNKLEDINGQIKEINSLGSLSITKEEDLETLKKQSTELEHQIDLLEMKKQNEERKLEKGAVSTLTTEGNSGYEDGITQLEAVELAIGRLRYLQNSIPQIEKNVREFEDKIKSGKELNPLETNEYNSQIKLLEEQKKEYEDSFTYATDTVQSIDEAGNALKGSTKESRELQKQIAQVDKSWDSIASSSEKYIKMSVSDKRGIVNDELLKAGVSYGNADSISNDLSEKELDLVAELTFDKNTTIDSIRKELKTAQKEADSKEIKAKLSVENVTSFSDYQKKIQDLQDKIQNPGNVKSSDVSDLMTQFPDFNWDTLLDKNGQVTTDITAIQDAIILLRENLKETAINACPQFKNAIEDMFYGTKEIDGYKDEIDDLNKVIKVQNKTGSISSDKANELIAKYPELASKVTKVGDAYVIEKDALQDVISARTVEANKAISTEVNTTNSIISSLQKRVKGYESECNAYIKSLNAKQKANMTNMKDARKTYNQYIGSYGDEGLALKAYESVYGKNTWTALHDAVISDVSAQLDSIDLSSYTNKLSKLYSTSKGLSGSSKSSSSSKSKSSSSSSSSNSTMFD